MVNNHLFIVIIDKYNILLYNLSGFEGDNIKNVLIIYNPNSGKKKDIYMILEKSKSLFEYYGYKYHYMETKYGGHAKNIVKNLTDIDLVISVGGDGTFNEIVSGNIEREQPLVLSHIPVGTTNDLRSLFGVGKDILKNIELILTGEDKQIDICMLNDNPFVYVSGFGKFVSLSYETPRSSKAKYGYFAYIKAAVKDFFKNSYMYDIEFEIDGVKHKGRYSLGVISNANRIAGINNFYKDVKLNDNTFEVLFCSINKRSTMLRSLFKLGIKDVTKVSGVELYRTSNLKIKFNNKLKKPWTIDGEKYPKKDNVYNITINRNIKFRISKKAIKDNCISN